MIYGALYVQGGIDPTYLALEPQLIGPTGFTNPLWLDTSGNLRSENILISNSLQVPTISHTGNITIDPSNNLIINGDLDISGNTGITTSIKSVLDTYKTQSIPAPYDVSFNALQLNNNLELKSEVPYLYLYDTQNKTWTVGEVSAGIRYVSGDNTTSLAGYERSNILVKVEDIFGQNFGLSFGTKRFDKTFVSQQMYLNRQGVLIIGRDVDIDPLYNSSTGQGPLLMISGPVKGIIELTSAKIDNLNDGVIGEIDFVNRGSNTNFKRKSAIISSMSGTNATATIGSNLQFLTATDGVDNNGIERMRITNTGNVGIGTTTPTNSAKLQLDSTTQGFLPPRMTGVQANAIATPAEGLMVYVTDAVTAPFLFKGWWGYNGATWTQLG